jgi:hypothetical protein
MSLPFNLNTTTPISYSVMDSNFNTITEAINGRQIIHNMSGDYTLQLEDCGKLFLWDSTNGLSTITIPQGVSFPYGQHIDFVWYIGGNDIVFAPDTGVTLKSYNNLTSIAGQFVAVTLIHTGVGEWLLIGNLK